MIRLPHLILALAFATGDATPIRVGETVSGTLLSTDEALADRGPARWFDLTSETDGPVTVSLETFDFDAFLRIEGGDHALVAEDDNGGVESNARVVLAARTGGRYRVAVAASKPSGGDFTLSVTTGDKPRPSGAPLLEAGVAYRRTAAERATARGDAQGALIHRSGEGNRLFSLGRLAEAKVVFEAALVAAPEAKFPLGEATALSALGIIHLRLGDPARAREFGERYVALALELGNRSVTGKALCGLGETYRALGQLGRARRCYERQISIARELGDRADEAVATLGIGNVDLAEASFESALTWFECYLEIAQSLGDRRAEARAYGSIGVVHVSLGNFDRARDFGLRALDLFRGLGDRAGEATALGNLGNAYRELGEISLARESYEKHREKAREIGDRAGEARAIGSLSTIHNDRGDFTEAREYAEQALAAFQALGDRRREATAWTGLGSVRYYLGDLEASLRCHE